jgi:hypothetical protein
MKDMRTQCMYDVERDALDSPILWCDGVEL